ncbi:hypothetical protein L9G74_06435 [Shewanella sp. C32]|uniref:Type II toxin-antitoxin system HicB family antitoxin n=1 Tax=Shewanella electrica TaxID=515560 RepID=A0ABT2FJ98_9GAMM|nr:hypothetical protein [Shewanella electrica]MCH1924168.1 hypothetical protein [Shewanella electrica]MCS4556071.1 hypothetical protein [Shewanella electrica]
MSNKIVIDGVQANVTLDQESGQYRGEFVGLNGGADFYANDLRHLEIEGRRSLQTYIAICKEKGLSCINDGPNQKDTRPTVNIDELLKTVRTSVQALPSSDLELCDLANELGIALAKLVGTDKSYESEVLSGIKHGFDLVRKNAEADNE